MELTRSYAKVNPPKFGAQRQRASGTGFISPPPSIQLWDCRMTIYTTNDLTIGQPQSRPLAIHHVMSPHTKLPTYIRWRLPVTVCCQVSIKLYLPIFTTILWLTIIHYTTFKTFTLMEVHSYFPSLRMFPKQKVYSGTYVQSTSHLTSPNS